MRKLTSEFVFPKYKDDCFSNIPATIFALFGISTDKPTIQKNYWRKYQKKFRNIIVFLIDSLGYLQWQETANYFPLFQEKQKPRLLAVDEAVSISARSAYKAEERTMGFAHGNLFKKLYEKKLVFPLTAVFPSTTSAAITTLHSSLTPAEHGLFEWILYFPEIGKTIVTLPFCPLDFPERDDLLKEKVKPKILFDNKTIHEVLVKHKVNSSLFLNSEYSESAYSKLISQGGAVISFESLEDLLGKLKNQMAEKEGRNLFSVYYDLYDALCHKYGPKSEMAKSELGEISALFLKEFLEKLDKKTKEETLIIITADHGQIEVNPNETIYLTGDKKIMAALKTDKNGNLILPTGSARDVFLHLKTPLIEKTYQYLLKKFKNKTLVLKLNEAIRLNLFGSLKIKKVFKDRLGDLLILPYKNYTVWQKYQDEGFQLLGAHGGLSKEEMLIPFSIFKLDEI